MKKFVLGVMVLCVSCLCFAGTKKLINVDDDYKLVITVDNEAMVYKASDTNIYINNPKIHVNYTQYTWSADRGSGSTSLYIDGNKGTSKDIDLTTSKTVTIRVDYSGSDIQGTVVKKTVTITYDNKIPTVQVSLYKIKTSDWSNSSNSGLKDKFTATNNFESITSIGSYSGTLNNQAYSVKITLKEGFAYLLNGNIHVTSGSTLSIAYTPASYYSSSSSTDEVNHTGGGGAAWGSTGFYFNDTAYNDDEYVYNSTSSIKFVLKITEGSSGTGSSTVENTSMAYLVKIYHGDSNIVDDGTESLATYSQSDWLTESEYGVLIKAVLSYGESGINTISSAGATDQQLGAKGVLYIYSDKTQSISITATDNIGNTYTSPTSISTKINVSNPVISIKKNDIDYISGDIGWCGKDNWLPDITITDSDSNLRKVQVLDGTTEIYTNENPDRDQYKLSSISLSSEGKHKITVKAWDDYSYDQNEEYVSQYFYVGIDDTAPTIGLSDVSIDKDWKITVKVTASDISGIQSLTCVGGEKNADGMYSYTLSNRDEKQTHKFMFTALDNMNYKTEQTLSVTIPKKFTVETPSASNDEIILANLITTNLNNSTETSYYTISYTKDITGYKDSLLSSYETSIKVSVPESNSTWPYVIQDVQPVTSGLGHHNVEYDFTVINNCSWEGFDTSGNIPVEEKTSVSGKYQNTKSKITWILTGADESSPLEITDADLSALKELTLPEDGLVKIGFRITDPDLEQYKVEMMQRIPETDLEIPQENFAKTVESDLTGISEGAFEKRFMPLYKGLDDGICKNYFLKVKEMNDDVNDVVITKSCEIGMEGNPLDLGGYCLLVGNADYSAKGISVQVNAALHIQVDETDESAQGSYDWNYGDDTVDTNKSSISHIYKQSETRTGDVSNYILKVTRNDVSTEINVYALDTRMGALAGDETWIGLHKILAQLTVPEKVTLAVCANEKDSANTTEVWVYGGKENAIIVQNGGTFTVDSGSPIFTNMKNTESGFMSCEATNFAEYSWGGIRVESGGGASISGATIQYCKQGITAEAGSTVTLKGVTSKGNQIGIHALGAATVNLSSCTITGNSLYGIKEDYVGDEDPSIVEVQTNDIKGNGTKDSEGNIKYQRNWYKAETGLKNK